MLELITIQFGILALFVAAKVLIITATESEIPLYTKLIQNIELELYNLEETANNLKTFESAAESVKQIIEHELPKFTVMTKKYENILLKDEYLVHALQNYKRFSDPLAQLWNQTTIMSDLSSKFFRKISSSVTSHQRSFEEIMGKETDVSSSDLVEKHLENLKSLLLKLIETRFSSAPPTEESLSSFQKTCQTLAVKVADHESLKQISERVKRAAAHELKDVQCTKGDEQKPSPRSSLLRWTEETNLKIPSSVTYSILTCYRLQICDAILHYLTFLLENENEAVQQLQTLQERETELALTAVWIREKFFNQTVHHQNPINTSEENENGLITNEVWMCDPAMQIYGETFLRFSGVFQTCIEQEYKLNPYGTCSGKCKYFREKHGGRLDSVASRLTCTTTNCNKNPLKNGHLHLINPKCKRLEGTVRVCESRKIDVRYDWFSVGSEIYGKALENGACDGELKTFKEDWRLETGVLSKIPQLCETCMCQCDHVEPGKKQAAYFSISEVVSEIEKNMVVTGVRFESKYGIIHASIETGRILESGKIDESTLNWVAPPLMTSDGEFDRESTLRLGLDFNVIYLDDIEASIAGIKMENCALTGIRFRHHKSHLSLEALMTQINPITKSLEPKTSIWINRIDDHRSRNIIEFSEADDPLLIPNPTKIISTFNGVKFGPASLLKTGGQLVTPYFDSQRVHSAQRKPIRSVGIFLKGYKDHGGFIAFKIEEVSYQSDFE